MPLNLSTQPELLTAAEEVELARRIEAGVLAEAVLRGELAGPPDASERELACLVADGRLAWDHFLAANLRLARQVAVQAHRRSGADVEELFQEGVVGLAEALRRFDTEAGVRFSTYAYSWIRNQVQECQARRVGRADLTLYRARQAWSLRRRQEELETSRGRSVSVRELAADVGRSSSWVQLTLVADRPHGGSDELELVGLQTPEPAGQGSEVSEPPEWLEGLGSLERRVLVLRYGLLDDVERTYDACAEQLGISASTVRRIERRALVAARDLLRSQPELLAA